MMRQIRKMRRALSRAAGAALFRLDDIVRLSKANHLLSRCARVGSDVRLRMPVIIYHPEKLQIGTSVDIGENVILRAGGGLSIGDRVLIAAGAAIVSVGHPIAPPRWNCVTSAPVSIGDDVWIGANAVILPGVTIGDGAIVGAGAVVKEDVPPFTLVAGVPATVVRRIDQPGRDLEEGHEASTG